jgi:hypothetical protein
MEEIINNITQRFITAGWNLVVAFLVVFVISCGFLGIYKIYCKENKQ